MIRSSKRVDLPSVVLDQFRAGVSIALPIDYGRSPPSLVQRYRIGDARDKDFAVAGILMTEDRQLREKPWPQLLNFWQG